jgi:hypothetical protein
MVFRTTERGSRSRAIFTCTFLAFIGEVASHGDNDTDLDAQEAIGSAEGFIGCEDRREPSGNTLHTHENRGEVAGDPTEEGTAVTPRM